MILADKVTELFHRNIDSCMQSIQPLSAPIAAASDVLVQSMLGERKVLCCGDGVSALIAQHFATNLLNRFHYDRPALPAMSLGSDTATVTAIASEGSYNDVFAKQIRALGQSGDTLFLCTQGGGSGTAPRAVQAAQERGMRIVHLCDGSSSDASALLSPDDVELRVPLQDRARVAEVQLLAVHALCELVDLQLFGNEV